MEKAVAVKVQFGTSDKKYTYLLPSVLIGQVCTGDYVIVPAGYGDMPYKVVKVVECTSDFNKWRRNDVDLILKTISNAKPIRRSLMNSMQLWSRFTLTVTSGTSSIL